MNKRVVITQGWNEVIVPFEEIIHAPKDRKINITEVKNFALFASNLETNKILYFDYMRLE
jgi:hypothetical protein